MNTLKKKLLIIISFLSISFLIPNNPSNSFIPKFYEPNTKELKKTGLDIGFIAANLIQMGQIKEGIGLVKVAISLNPDEVDLWMILAEGQIQRRNLKDALKSINEAKKYNPKLSSLWFTEASIALNLNNPDLAISSIESGLKIEPDNAKAYFQLGNAKIMKKKFKSALDDFHNAYSLNKDFWQAVNNEALIFYELGEIKKAIKSWRKTLLIEKDPEPKLALAVALNYINPGNEESIQLSIEALKENPDYIHEKYRKEQLWGEKLQAATKRLLENPLLENAIKKALARSNFENE